MILFTPVITPRVNYMAAWLGNYLFGNSLEVTDREPGAGTGKFVFNYSAQHLAAPGYQVIPAGLLPENSVRRQNIIIRNAAKYPELLFDDAQKPFDLLSAIFYLVSRYEEYLPFTPDEYGRFPHTGSIAFTQGFLKRPLVDEWMADLKKKLEDSCPGIRFKKQDFVYIPTYDIDIAWCYRNKGFARSLGGLLKDLLAGRTTLVGARLKALTSRMQDPFDVFENLDRLHRQFELKPLFFFLLAARYRGYDRNISTGNAAYRQLIKDIAGRYDTGIHLSWQASGDPQIMQQEKRRLEDITHREISANRMHYINFHLPETYEYLESIGITEDYSMGYGSINGFRASTCQPYLWYNLAKECGTGLTVIPFAYMEANSIFEEKENAAGALASLRQYYDAVKNVNGTLVTIFHNHLIGYDKIGRVWWNLYRQFLENCF